MRQYTRVKGEKGRKFTYQDVKKVYTIVLFEKSTEAFHDFPYPKDRSEQTAWLSLLASESVEEADKLIKEYPWLEKIYLKERYSNADNGAEERFNNTREEFLVRAKRERTSRIKTAIRAAAAEKRGIRKEISSYTD